VILLGQPNDLMCTACLDDPEDKRGHVKDEQRQFAPEDVPDARDWTVLGFEAGNEHLASHVLAQRLGLRVAVDTMTSHVYRPGRTKIHTTVTGFRPST